MKLERLSGDALTDVRYLVSFDEPVFIIGFKLESMIESLVYVVLEPLAGLKKLKKSELAALRAKFAEYDDYNYFCQVEDWQRARFAEFFGFKSDGLVWGRIHMIKGKN